MNQKVQNVKMVSVSVCVHVSVCICMCVCGVPNVKLVSLACMPNDPKSVKCKNGICICVYIYILSIFGMYAK